MPGKITNIDANHVAESYLSGEAEWTIAKRLGVSRQVIRRQLLQVGVKIRTQSESSNLVYATRGADFAKAITASANVAARGRKASEGERIKRAINIEQTQSRTSPLEDVVLTWLDAYKVTRQKALSIYNIDLFLEESAIAVEVFGGSWHASGHHLAAHVQRCKYILDQGINIIIIWSTFFHPIVDIGKEQLIRQIEELRGLPAGSRQYRVILGDGKPAGVSKSQLNDPATIEARGCRL